MATNNLTTNLNLLAPTGFRLTINREKFANTEFFVTSFSLPSLNLGETQVNYKNATGYAPGETLTFDSLSMRLAIDEGMESYSELLNWMVRNETTLEVNDMIISILGNTSNSNKQIQFSNVFPVSVSGVEFSTQATDVEYLQTDITFRYDRFTIL
tara:strand:+ start:6970 stop:7434 length:465 start_codon:yes stop_codon:yes gene_type:complete